MVKFVVSMQWNHFILEEMHIKTASINVFSVINHLIFLNVVLVFTQTYRVNDTTILLNEIRLFFLLINNYYIQIKPFLVQCNNKWGGPSRNYVMQANSSAVIGRRDVKNCATCKKVIAKRRYNQGRRNEFF
jgi:hypothetical protein